MPAGMKSVGATEGGAVRCPRRLRPQAGGAWGPVTCGEIGRRQETDHAQETHHIGDHCGRRDAVGSLRRGRMATMIGVLLTGC